MRFAFKWMLRLSVLAAFLVAAIVVGAAVNARSRVPDLKPWHRLVPAAEVHARDAGPDFTLDQYLACVWFYETHCQTQQYGFARS